MKTHFPSFDELLNRNQQEVKQPEIETVQVQHEVAQVVAKFWIGGYLSLVRDIIVSRNCGLIMSLELLCSTLSSSYISRGAYIKL